MVKEAEIYNNLVSWFKNRNGVLVAFSGGVDSTLVAVAARDALGDRTVAVTAKSYTLPPWELREAIELANELEIRHVVIEVNELEDPAFRRNPPNRCYFCKKQLFRNLKKLAEEMGLEIVVDGANADDIRGHRPGYFACIEEEVKSPLAELGIGKSDVRKISRFLGLPTADKPSMACLASRIPYGEEITEEKLFRIAEAETFIRGRVGVGQLRVRAHGDVARIEVGRNERKKFFDEDLLDQIHGKLRSLGFKYVTFDLYGYRSGSMDEVLREKMIPIHGEAEEKWPSGVF